MESMPATQSSEGTTATALQRAYGAVRADTEAICEPLTPEDQVIQTMPSVSPTKWHLAHASWLFEPRERMGFRLADDV